MGDGFERSWPVGGWDEYQQKHLDRSHLSGFKQSGHAGRGRQFILTYTQAGRIGMGDGFERSWPVGGWDEYQQKHLDRSHLSGFKQSGHAGRGRQFILTYTQAGRVGMGDRFKGSWPVGGWDEYQQEYLDKRALIIEQPTSGKSDWPVCGIMVTRMGHTGSLTSKTRPFAMDGRNLCVFTGARIPAFLLE